jgi:hypothetical protein
MTDRQIVRWALGTVPRVMIRPWLWRAALRFVAWPPWRSWPYLRFRYVTAYGDAEGDSADVVPFLYWCRGMDELRKKRG